MRRRAHFVERLRVRKTSTLGFGTAVRLIVRERAPNLLLH